MFLCFSSIGLILSDKTHFWTQIELSCSQDPSIKNIMNYFYVGNWFKSIISQYYKISMMLKHCLFVTWKFLKGLPHEETFNKTNIDIKIIIKKAFFIQNNIIIFRTLFNYVTGIRPLKHPLTFHIQALQVSSSTSNLYHPFHFHSSQSRSLLTTQYCITY